MATQKNILFLTTMYPNSLRPSTPVCHYFTREWVKMGYNVLVIYYRSMFPWYYSMAAKLFPGLAKRVVGNHVEMDRKKCILKEEKDGVMVYSIPIFKYKPHGKYGKNEICKQVKTLLGILDDKQFKPDAIIGHFYNPQMEIISQLKVKFPDARTCVSLHELNMAVIRNNYINNFDDIISRIDVIGYRSVPIKNMFEESFGKRTSLLCPSGTSPEYISAPLRPKNFTDGPLRSFLYVGQYIRRKYPELVIQAINEVYGCDDFQMNYIGSKEFFYQSTEQYINEHHLEHKARMIGKVPREEIISYYDKADCFIMISKGEVFGLVYLEAMSRGCITIAGRNEGMEGIIKDGVNGFFCDPGNLDELKEVINKINNLSKPEKEVISQNAIETARIFSDKRVAQSYIDNVFNPNSDNLI